MYQSVFRIEGDGPYERATGSGDTAIELWCNDHCDLLHIADDRGDRVVDHLRSTVGIRERVRNGDDQVVITETCLKRGTETTVESYLASHGCLLLPPLRYEDGAKVVRVLALSAENLTGFYREVTSDYRVTVESKKELSSVTPESPLLSLESLLPTLSKRQSEVYHAAHELGYFEIPRRATTSEIAEAVGVERRTAEHHLRRAEQKIADALVGYL